MGAPEPIGNPVSGITTYYVPPPNEPPNMFAAFWSGFLATRTPEAHAVFMARLKAADPSARYKALDEMEKYRVELHKIAATNEVEAAKINNARDIESSQAKRSYYASDISKYNAETSAGATRDAAAMGLEGHVIEAGKLTPRSQGILDDYRTREQDAQRHLATAAEQPPGQARDDAYAAARVERALVAAGGKKALEAVPPVERTSLLQAIQGDPLIINDEAGQEFVQQIRAGIGTPQQVEVPIPRSGGRAPPKPTDVDLEPMDTSGGRSRATLDRVRGGGTSSPEGGGNLAPVGNRAPTAPSSRSPAVLPGTSSVQRGAQAPARSPSTEEDSPDEREPDADADDVKAPRQRGGQFNEDELHDELDRVDQLQAKMMLERLRDPTNGLGGHWDPLGSPGSGRKPAPRSTTGASPRPADRASARSQRKGDEMVDDDRSKMRAQGVMSRLYGTAKPIEDLGAVPSETGRSEPDNAVKGPEKPEAPAPKKRRSGLADAVTAAQQRNTDAQASQTEGLQRSRDLADDALTRGPQKRDQADDDDAAADTISDPEGELDTADDKAARARRKLDRMLGR